MDLFHPLTWRNASIEQLFCIATLYYAWGQTVGYSQMRVESGARACGTFSMPLSVHGIFWHFKVYSGCLRSVCVRACVFVHVCANCMCVCACLYVCVCVCVLALIRSHTQAQASFPDEVSCLQSQEVLIVMRYWRHPWQPGRKPSHGQDNMASWMWVAIVQSFS